MERVSAPASLGFVPSSPTGYRQYAASIGACEALTGFCLKLGAEVPDGASWLRSFEDRLPGTVRGPRVASRRAHLATDFACRVALPAALRAGGRQAEADGLAALEPVRNRLSRNAAYDVLADIELALDDARPRPRIGVSPPRVYLATWYAIEAVEFLGFDLVCAATCLAATHAALAVAGSDALEGVLSCIDGMFALGNRSR